MLLFCLLQCCKKPAIINLSEQELKKKKVLASHCFSVRHGNKRKCDLNTVEGRVRQLEVTQDGSVMT